MLDVYKTFQFKLSLKKPKKNLAKKSKDITFPMPSNDQPNFLPKLFPIYNNVLQEIIERKSIVSDLNGDVFNAINES